MPEKDNSYLGNCWSGNTVPSFEDLEAGRHLPHHNSPAQCQNCKGTEMTYSDYK